MKTPKLEQAISKRLRVHFAMSPQVPLRCQWDEITQESGYATLPTAQGWAGESQREKLLDGVSHGPPSILDHNVLNTFTNWLS